MPAYMIIESKVKDPASYAGYIERVPPIVAAYGGRYLVRGGKVTPMAGGWMPERIIILEFPSKEDIRRCFSSPEYKKISPLRDAGVDLRSVVVEGYTQEEG